MLFSHPIINLILQNDINNTSRLKPGLKQSVRLNAFRLKKAQRKHAPPEV